VLKHPRLALVISEAAARVFEDPRGHHLFDLSEVGREPVRLIQGDVIDLAKHLLSCNDQSLIKIAE
jgi:hypothetical protein